MSSGPDIRKFFGSSKKEQPSSALAALRSTVRSSPKAKEVPKVSPKTMKPSVDAKKRSEKHTSKQQKEELLEILSESDGESPIPKSKKTTLKSVKRKPTVLDSDDEEIIPRRAKASRPLSGTPSPSKKQSSRKKILISSESEASPSPRKKQQKKSAVVSSDDEEEPVKISSESDSEEEPLPQKSRKRMLPPGQKKLKLTAKTKSSVPETTPEASSDVGLEKVSAADYFGSSAKKVGKKKETPKKTREEFVELEETFTKKSKTSPRQRTPKKVVASVVEDEFLEEDDRVAEPVTIKKKENTLKRKDAIPKKTSRNREFNDSDDEIISKTNKISPSSKENQPKKPKRKEQEVKEKLLVKPPTFIAGTPASTAEREVKEYELPWVDKYKPKTTSQLVGQHGEKSPMNKLLGWLGDWAKNNLGEGGKTKKPKPAPFMSQADGTAFKAALLSGSPGVGKTTCAHMACESLGLKFVEMNASDVRNKKHLEAQIAQLTGSHQIEEYFGRTTNDSHEDTEIHHVLIMDEVDGMSGNEDRAGIAELIQMIKETKIPIICICNDRSHPKMRSLVNHCYDLRFPRPRVEQIRGRVMTIAAQEKVKITKDEVDELIELSAHDVRQVIYNLQMRSTAVKSKIEKKDCAINTFEAARKLLDSRSSIMEKQEMFFVDYGIMPLFVHENYLNMKNKTHSKAESLKCIREAADLISLGDTVDKCIRSTGAWKLLNEQAMFSAVMPTIATDGHMGSMIQFPSWLGKNSTAGKRQRLMRQLASHAHLKISADTHSLVTDYVPALRRALTDPLLRQENEGVPDVVATMTEYDLLKDDAEAIGELAVWPGKIDPASKIPSKVKATLTRALNKEHRILPYHLEDVTKGRRRAAATVEIEVDEDGNLVERVDGEEEEPEGDEEEETNPGVVKSSTSSRGKGAARAGRGARGKK